MVIVFLEGRFIFVFSCYPDRSQPIVFAESLNAFFFYEIGLRSNFFGRFFCFHFLTFAQIELCLSRKENFVIPRSRKPIVVQLLVYFLNSERSTYRVGPAKLIPLLINILLLKILFVS